MKERDMVDFKFVVGAVTLRVRHAGGAKGIRKVADSLTQKLRNLGGSASHSVSDANAQVLYVAFAFACPEVEAAQRFLQSLDRLLIGDFEVLEFQSEVLDYSNLCQNPSPDPMLEERDP
jgi:hypothetical protein